MKIKLLIMAIVMPTVIFAATVDTILDSFSDKDGYSVINMPKDVLNVTFDIAAFTGSSEIATLKGKVNYIKAVISSEENKSAALLSKRSEAEEISGLVKIADLNEQGKVTTLFMKMDGDKITDLLLFYKESGKSTFVVYVSGTLTAEDLVTLSKLNIPGLGSLGMLK